LRMYEATENIINNLISVLIPTNFYYESWNFNSGNYLFTTDTK